MNNAVIAGNAVNAGNCSIRLRSGIYVNLRLSVVESRF
jgi:hypothetical protein